MRKFAKNQVTFLLYGFGFWLPVAVIIFIIVILFSNLEDVGRRVLLAWLPEKYFHPGFGILFGILLLYISGIILKLTKIRKIFSKIPIIGLFFGAGEVITIERLLHLTPCLFLISPTCISYGWILSAEKVRLSENEATFPILNVYYPNVPTLITGQVFPVRKDTVIKLGNSSKEVIDLLLYSFRSPNELKYLPWEEESPEDFEKRAKSFGLNVNTGS